MIDFLFERTRAFFRFILEDDSSEEKRTYAHCTYVLFGAVAVVGLQIIVDSIAAGDLFGAVAWLMLFCSFELAALVFIDECE